MFDALEPLTMKPQNILNLLQETDDPGGDGYSHRKVIIGHPRSLAAPGRILRRQNASIGSTAATAYGRMSLLGC